VISCGLAWLLKLWTSSKPKKTRTHVYLHASRSSFSPAVLEHHGYRQPVVLLGPISLRERFRFRYHRGRIELLFAPMSAELSPKRREEESEGLLNKGHKKLIHRSQKCRTVFQRFLSRAKSKNRAEIRYLRTSSSSLARLLSSSTTSSSCHRATLGASTSTSSLSSGSIGSSLPAPVRVMLLNPSPRLSVSESELTTFWDLARCFSWVFEVVGFEEAGRGRRGMVEATVKLRRANGASENAPDME
jgi:hypothetical protein